MRILLYPHPTLARRSRPLARVDAEVHRLVAEMFDLMYQHRGVGLAANQVDLPYRLFVMNFSGDASQKDLEQVFLNPVLRQPKGSAEEEEGCLSLPELYAPVRRPERIIVNAFNLAGQEITQELTGLPARIVQHEYDHLDGVLFIDRLGPASRLDLKERLLDFEDEFASRLERGEIPPAADILARLARLEAERT